MWIMPTLNRIEKLTNFINAAKKTKMSTPMIVATDQEDYEKNKVFYDNLKDVFLPQWEFRITNARGMGDKVREIYPTLTSANWIGLLNDDHEPVTDNWDTLIIDLLDGLNFVSSNDRTQRTFVLPVTATAFSKRLLDIAGFPIYPEGMKHLFIDDLWRDIGKASGCWRIQAHAVVLHNHVIFGKSEADETHKIVYNQEQWNHDKAVYEKFKAEQMQDLLKRIFMAQNEIPKPQRYNPDMQEKLKNEVAL